MSKVLITGASGYIGGRLVPRLQEQGFELHGVVREPAPRMSIPQTVCDLGQKSSLDALTRACEGVRAVIHLAGENELVAVRQPADALASTVVATEIVSEACARAGVERLFYMSTVHVYGARMTPGAVLREDMRVEPRSAYAISRLASEHVAAALAGEAYELVIFRLTNSVGAPDHPSVNRWSLLTNDLARQGAVSGRLTLRSSGTQWRDFVPLSDVCSAIASAIGNGPPAFPADTYNLGSGRPRTVRSVAGMVQDAFERETGARPPLVAPEPEADPPAAYEVSVTRADAAGLRLAAPLEEAVAETVRFCLAHRDALR